MATEEIFVRMESELAKITETWEWVVQVSHHVANDPARVNYTAITMAAERVQLLQQLLQDLRVAYHAKVTNSIPEVGALPNPPATQEAPPPPDNMVVDFADGFDDVGDLGYLHATIPRLLPTHTPNPRFTGEEAFLARVGPWRLGEGRVEFIVRCVSSAIPSDFTDWDFRIAYMFRRGYFRDITTKELRGMDPMSHAAFFLTGRYLDHCHNQIQPTPRTVAIIGKRHFNLEPEESRARFAYSRLLERYPRIFCFRGLSMDWLTTDHAHFLADLEDTQHDSPATFMWLRHMEWCPSKKNKEIL